MGFPDRIERTVELPHPPGKVWAALTTAEGLAAWFGDEAAIDLRPGGSARMTWTGGPTAEMRVERGEEPAGFGVTCGLYGLPGEDPQAPGPAGGRRPGEGRTGGAARGALPVALCADAGGPAVPGRAGPRLGQHARRADRPPRPG